MMKRKKKMKNLGKRILSMCLCIALMSGLFPMVAMAENVQEKITVETLEGLAEPTEFPAEGTMHLYVLKETSLGENYVDSFEEAYLPVIVTQNKHVYAKLSALQGHLGMRVDGSDGPKGEAVRTVRYHNSALFLKAGDSSATYTMYMSNGYGDKDSIYPYTNFRLGNAPLMYKEEFYVPLDAFLQCTGSLAFYAGENDMGKQDLYITPPQRTVLDDMLYVCREAYSEYRFDFQKDFGFTPEGVEDTYYSAELAQYMKRFGSLFDGAAWSMSFTDDKYFDDKYLDMYMDYALHASEEILNKNWDTASSILDISALILDVTELSISKDWEKSTVVTNWFLDQFGGTKQLNKVREGSNNLGTGAFIGGNALNYWSICASLYGADQISVNGAELLLNEYSDLVNHQFLSEQNAKRAKKSIEDYGEKLGINAFGRWVEEYWMSNGVSFAKILTDGMGTSNVALGVAGVASAVWSVGTDLLLDNALDSTESFMASYLGQQYAYEILPSISRSITAYIKGEMSEEDVRSIVYHALASCYAARHLGCVAMQEQLVYYKGKMGDEKTRISQQVDEQKKVNENIAQMLSVLQCTGIQMGMRQKDYYNFDYHEELHYDNVYFNVCQVQGRIHYIDKEKPADNLEVWISDETGAMLAEFKTDKAGDFDVSFAVEDVSIFDEGELQKQITFHIEEWWYPEILETVEIPIFRKAQVNGLWAGKLEETINCYLEDANEENGQVILNIRKIDIIGDRDTMINMNMPTFFGEGSYETYVLGSDDYVLSDNIERIVLEDDMTFGTIFSEMYPDGTWAGELMQIFAGAGLSSDYAMDAMMNSDMHEASEIYEFIEQYKAVNGDYPTYEIQKVNSRIDSIEPTLIELYE